MRLGEKEQRACPKMKKWQSIINIKSMLVVSSLVIVVIMVTVVASNIRKTTSDAYSILMNKRFVFVKSMSDIEENNDFGTGFDLKNKEFYYSYGAAIKDNKLFGGSSKYEAKEYYERALNNEISSILLNLNVRPDEIKKSNYQITRSPESLVNKSLLKEKYPPEFELQYIYREEDQFSKVRITYNKDFLPTKIEWYYKGEEGLKWYTWRTYSYPFKNKEEFDKRLDEEMANIEEISRENEGD